MYSIFNIYFPSSVVFVNINQMMRYPREGASWSINDIRTAVMFYGFLHLWTLLLTVLLQICIGNMDCYTPHEDSG